MIVGEKKYLSLWRFIAFAFPLWGSCNNDWFSSNNQMRWCPLIWWNGQNCFKELKVLTDCPPNTLQCVSRPCILGPLHTQAKSRDHSNFEGPWFSCKGPTTHMYAIICVRPTYLLEVDLTQTPTDDETLFIAYHVGIHTEFSTMIVSLDPWTVAF